jgi:quercetin dioxygenase-like cupin family protein
MSTRAMNPSLPVRPPPEVVDTELDTVLSEPVARAGERALLAGVAPPSPRGRLLARVAATRDAESGMFTARRRRLARQPFGEGVTAQTLYLAQAGQALRPGEPLRARLIEIAPGQRLEPARWGDEAELSARHREWLVLSGDVRAGGEHLSPRDYQVTPAGHATPRWSSDDGALLFLRESLAAAAARDAPFVVRDADAGWPDHAPGVQRRVLWQHGGQAAMLYYAQPGAQVPQHRHGHDEECLMLQGELFLDDMLLQPGDYQLASAGTGHRVTSTDTGAVIYAHGDLDLQFVP